MEGGNQFEGETRYLMMRSPQAGPFSTVASTPDTPASTTLKGNTWVVESHVDADNVMIHSQDHGKEVLVKGCRGFSQQCVVTIRGPVRSIIIEDCGLPPQYPKPSTLGFLHARHGRLLNPKLC